MNQVRVKVSVIVPTCNHEASIRDCLGSILSQGMQDMEVICVDAGSKDRTAAAIAEAEKQDGRVRFIQASRKNCGYQLNRGLHEAKGEHVSFVWPEDRIDGDMHIALAKIADQEKLDFVLSDFAWESGDGNSDSGNISSDGNGSYGKGDTDSHHGRAHVRLSQHHSCYGHVVNPAKEQAWKDFPRCLGSGLYRREFLLENRIRFNELAGSGIPVTSFLFQVFMHAKRAYFVDVPYYHREQHAEDNAGSVSGNAFGSTFREGQVSTQEAWDVFKEYDFLGAVLRQDEPLRKAFGHAYALSCFRDILALLPHVPAFCQREYVERAATCLRDLHDEGMIDYYALAPEEHRELSLILFDTEGYAEKQILGGTPSLSMAYLFPYHLFPAGSKVAIYGAGSIGRAIYRQAMHDGYVNVVGIVDRNAVSLAAEDFPVQPVQSLQGMDYDYVLLAIRERSVADGVRRDLDGLGIPGQRVLWDGNAYQRDDFYRNMYFPMLRAWNGDCLTHDRLVETFRARSRGIIYDHVFPYHLFPEGTRVVLYGAGDIGKKFYRQAVQDGYVHVVGIVDRNAANLPVSGIPVQPITKLRDMFYDYVLITVHGPQETADAIRRDLEKLGVPGRKVKWDGGAYHRDEFIQGLYLPMLRAWNGTWAGHGQFLHEFTVKMEGSLCDHAFPYHLFAEGTRVALYGAGDIGRKFYHQAIRDDYVKIVGIVDRNAGDIYAPGIPVQGVDRLKDMPYDQVLITVHGPAETANAIREDLGRQGIPAERIQWDGETYYRDEFYRNVYLPMLRELGGNFRSRDEMLDAVAKALRMAIYDHIFPYRLFKDGETIAIYGAGDVGRKFYRQAQDYDYVKVVVMVDQNAENIHLPGIPVAPVAALKQFRFDSVLISITNPEAAQEVRQSLMYMGIPEEKIKWDGTLYYRDHYYKNFYFEYLRFVHSMRESKI